MEVHDVICHMWRFVHHDYYLGQESLSYECRSTDIQAMVPLEVSPFARFPWRLDLTKTLSEICALIRAITAVQPWHGDKVLTLQGYYSSVNSKER
jgi:hypothetical protein